MGEVERQERGGELIIAISLRSQLESLIIYPVIPAVFFALPQFIAISLHFQLESLKISLAIPAIAIILS